MSLVSPHGPSEHGEPGEHGPIIDENHLAEEDLEYINTAKGNDGDDGDDGDDSDDGNNQLPHFEGLEPGDLPLWVLAMKSAHLADAADAGQPTGQEQFDMETEQEEQEEPAQPSEPKPNDRDTVDAVDAVLWRLMVLWRANHNFATWTETRIDEFVQDVVDVVTKDEG